MTTTVDPDDRRGRLVSLTKAGRTVLRAALPIWRRVHGEIDRQLSPANGKVLRGGLRALSYAERGTPGPLMFFRTANLRLAS